MRQAWTHVRVTEGFARRGLALLTACSAFFGAAGLAEAQTGANVAVVINERSSDSARIAAYYIAKREIPAENVIRITVELEESITRGAYLRGIEQPIAAAIKKGGLQDRILYIVLTKGVPLRVVGTSGADGTVASVDSELTLLYRRLAGEAVPSRGRVNNPYYLGDQPLASAQVFSHRAFPLYLVTRLDAFTVEEAIALIDRAQAPVSMGRFVLDQRAALPGSASGDRWLGEAGRRLRDLGLGHQLTLESTTQGARNLDEVLGFYSWGSNDPQHRVRTLGLRFVPGALAATFVSTDARTFQNPPDAWVPTSDWNNRLSWFGGSPQTLIGDLVREGVTGVAGHVAEPYLQSTVRPDVLFPAYARGHNLAEAFYLAMPHLSWQTVVLGDPLCSPFPRSAMSSEDLNPAPDGDTEFPEFFAGRRKAIARAQLKFVPAAAVDLMLKAEARMDRGHMDGGRAALSEAVKVAPKLDSVLVQLGLNEARLGNQQAAAEWYRSALEVNPDNAVALNNLAYILGVHQNNLAEALPLAYRAEGVAPNDGAVIDTLAWLEYLSGNVESAERRMRQAVRRSGADAEVRLHAAIVFAAVGDTLAAEVQLREAVRIDPSLEERPEAIKLRQRLRTPGGV